MTLYVKYLVCYDIENNKLRTKFFNFLRDLGLTPIQKSVFYGDLKPPEVTALKLTAKKLLEPEADSCLFFPCHLTPEAIRSCPGFSEFEYEEPDGHRVL